ncbi:MAG: hypothetical protein PHY48_13980 [Candidatus Cloacimonetes bacterium]|nr:hypothetical protein [Candidatus Cloacimonadota bacterium]
MNDEILKELRVLNRLLAMNTIISVEKGRTWNENAETFLFAKSSELIAKIAEKHMSDQSPKEQ